MSARVRYPNSSGTVTRPGASIAAYAAYGPPGSEDFFLRNFVQSVGLIPAWLPNFGDCLYHTISEIFVRGHGAAVVLNPTTGAMNRCRGPWKMM